MRLYQRDSKKQTDRELLDASIALYLHRRAAKHSMEVIVT